MIIWMTLATPNSVVNAHGIVPHTPKASAACIATDKATLLNMLLADCPAAELADCPRFFFTFDAFHVCDEMPPK